MDEEGYIEEIFKGVKEEVSINLDIIFCKFIGSWGYSVLFFYN